MPLLVRLHGCTQNPDDFAAGTAMNTLAAEHGFYVLYPAGLVVFAVMPAVRKHDWRAAAVLGGLLGLVAYGTYDLSNLATLRGWPWQMTVIDMAWGTFLSGVAACGGYVAGDR